MRLNFRNTGINGRWKYYRLYPQIFCIWDNQRKKQPAAEKNISLYNKMSSEKL